MYQDEIILEVWRNRDAYVAKHHHSLDEIVTDIQARQKEFGSKLVDRREHKKDFARPTGVLYSTEELHG
uniref:Uncharacterized protein n=1 Tax=Candidatus Kentrum sp. LPFa TaxID=2126335 RepID=A0A450XTW6_9GAMM|nr:MAG: hypothetical protein BECKLPF1236A_GA0070988_101742 [Candidatus Kentron sp. LPFa]VFK32751.1 MAG: hypothetical protein BECKLPF1236C_GA0070990_101801 [Candidatus Kentron sp. LPFa]